MTRSPFNSRLESGIRLESLPLPLFPTNLISRHIQKLSWPLFIPRHSFPRTRDLGTINLHGSMDPRIITRELGKLARATPNSSEKEFWKEGTPGVVVCTPLMRCCFALEAECEIWTRDRRVEASWGGGEGRLESRRVHPPEEFGGIRIMSSTGTARELALTPWQPTLNFYPRYRCASLNFREDIRAREEGQGNFNSLCLIITSPPFFLVQLDKKIRRSCRKQERERKKFYIQNYKNASFQYMRRIEGKIKNFRIEDANDKWKN